MKNNNKTKNLSYWGYVVIGCGMFFVICILVYQYYQWFKTGEWYSLPIYKPLQYLGIRFDSLLDVKWQTLQKFLFWILEQSLAGVIGIFSLMVGWLMTMRD